MEKSEFETVECAEKFNFKTFSLLRTKARDFRLLQALKLHTLQQPDLFFFFKCFQCVQQLFHMCLAVSLPILASTQEQEGKDEPCHDWNSAHFVALSCNTHPHTEREKKIDITKIM